MAGGLLDLLRRYRGQWLSMSDLQRQLGVSAGVVRDEIDGLKRMGYALEFVPAFGFRLMGSGEQFNADHIEIGLGTVRVGRKVLVYEMTDSTNDVAWHYEGGGGYDGLAVFSEQQRCGRGRLGRSWEDSKGMSLLCSVLLEGAGSLCSQALTLSAGLSVAGAVEGCCSFRVRIKWPNDVIYEGRKLAGVMVESRRSGDSCSYVIGIGINCGQGEADFGSELRGRAVSLAGVTGESVDRVVLAQSLLRRLDYWVGEIEAGRTEEIHREWLGRCDDIGRHLTLVSDGKFYRGRVVDVSATEGLLMQLDGGGVKFFDSATTSVKV